MLQIDKLLDECGIGYTQQQLQQLQVLIKEQSNQSEADFCVKCHQETQEKETRIGPISKDYSLRKSYQTSRIIEGHPESEQSIKNNSENDLSGLKTASNMKENVLSDKLKTITNEKSGKNSDLSKGRDSSSEKKVLLRFMPKGNPLNGFKSIALKSTSAKDTLDSEANENVPKWTGIKFINDAVRGPSDAHFTKTNAIESPERQHCQIATKDYPNEVPCSSDEDNLSLNAIYENTVFEQNCDVKSTAEGYNTFESLETLKSHTNAQEKYDIGRNSSLEPNFLSEEACSNFELFQCEFCQNSFSSAVNLAKHHNSETCCLCCKSFSQDESQAHYNFHKVSTRCRFCDHMFKTLKDKEDHEKNAHQKRRLVELYELCNSPKVAKNDSEKIKNMSTNKCEICDKMFHNFVELHEHKRSVHAPKDTEKKELVDLQDPKKIVHQSIIHLPSQLTCEICKFAFDSKESYQKHTLRTDDTCCACKRPFENQGQLRDHEQLKSCEIACTLCGAFVKTWPGLQDHLKAHKRSISINGVNIERSTMNKYKCSNCRNVFNNENVPKQHSTSPNCCICGLQMDVSDGKNRRDLHLEFHFQNTFCEPCDYMFETKEALDNHKVIFSHEVGKVHNYPNFDKVDLSSTTEMEGFSCKKCRKIFDTKQRFLNHVNQMNCCICPTVYQNQSERLDHDSFHDAQTRCKLCGYVAKNVNGLKIHKRFIHGNILFKEVGFKNLPMEICGRCKLNFHSEDQLVEHTYARHSDDAHLRCTLCKTKFSSEEVLKMHIDDPHCCKCTLIIGTKEGRESHTLYHKVMTGCETCGLVFRSESHQIDHIRECHKELFKARMKDCYCQICDLDFEDFEYYDHHMHLRHGFSKDFPCTFCYQRKYCLWNSRAIHRKGCKGRVSAEELKGILDEIDSAVNMNYIDTLNRVALKDTERNENSQEVNAKIDDLDFHSKVAISNEKKKCKQCGLEFNFRLTYDQHVYLVHSGKGNEKKCVQCNKIFNSEVSLWNHVTTPNACKAPPLCAFCGKTFATESSLEDHMAFHDGNTTCEHCGKIYERASSLRKHIRVVHERKRVVQCDICNKEFRDPSSLKSHMDHVHLKVKNFSCDKCDYMCVTPTMLENHKKRKHENTQKEKKCPDCGKSFLLNIELKSHFNRVHKQLKPHQCGSCDKSFFTKQCLKIHFARIHEQRREKCPYCGDLYAQLKEHVKRMHTDDINNSKEMPMH